MSQNAGLMLWVDLNKLLKETELSGKPAEDPDFFAWWSEKHFKEEQKLATKDRKTTKMARKSGLPAVLRGTLWLKLSGGAAFLAEDPKRFARNLVSVYGKGGESHKPDEYPEFGSVVKLERFCLTPDGINKCKRVLVAVAHEHQEAYFCPWLPLVAACCLHWMDEAQAFSCICALLREPSPFIETRLDSWLMLEVFSNLARLLNKPAVDALYSKTSFDPSSDLGPCHPLVGACGNWMSKLPFWVLTRVIDNFIIEGQKAIFRCSLAILARWHKESIKKPTVGRLPKDTALEINLPDKFIEEAYSYSFSRDQLNKWRSKRYHHCLELMTQHGRQLAVWEKKEKPRHRDGVRVLSSVSSYSELPLPIHPPVLSTSTIISTEHWRELWKDVPIRFHVKEMRKRFTTEDHGYSLNSLFRVCEDESPTLLLIKAQNGDRFGAFCPHPWSERKRRQGPYFFGTGETFVFSLLPDGGYLSYKWVGIARDAEDNEDLPSFFMIGDSERIAIGSGPNGAAVEVDRDLLYGFSGPSPTFNNKPLCSESPFRCAAIEVWAFEARD